MLLELFAFGSIPFIIVFGILPALALITLVDQRNGFSSGLGVVIITALLVTLLSNFNPFSWLINHTYEVAFYALIYFVAAVIYGTFRWYLFLRDRAAEYQKERDERLPTWLTQNSYADLSSEKAQLEFRNYMRGCMSGEFPPHPRNNKARIVAWMAYWPFSALWVFTHRPLMWIWDTVHDFTANLYARMSRRVFGRFAEFDSYDR